MNPTFSLIHATLGRPEKAVQAMRMWRDRATDPSSVEYIMCADSDDETRLNLRLGPENTAGFHSFLFVDHHGTGSAPAWDFAARFSRGSILIQVQDDVECPWRWNALLSEAILMNGQGKGVLDPIVIAVSDGYRKDKLMCTAICSRSFYQAEGHFLCPHYQSVFSDNEFTYRAYLRQSQNCAIVIEARDIVFLHRHHYHDKSVPFDATYAHENSDEAYKLGEALFWKRNPEAFEWTAKNIF
jgi:hypothetical protein